ncbi:AI-2E family transporter [Roseofilum sp. BLCC_M154]|uniref:AI-2E family transporter n=1 Tax=Roseofilum acuticapitatum BLCC-M154 TaxID=3022444 RepID=A0ABT7ANY2_9CYAN|nr:AI-2E family transporter [Roseofilum acuticapitatum]MDJ1168021.1 AI-2E family transporter [Roseofilum acuticapitatum BLCC-M154]
MTLGQLLGFFSLITSLYILWTIRSILLLVFTAIVLATALNRGVRLVQKFGLSRGLSVLVTISVTFLCFLLFYWIIVPPFIEQFQILINLIPTGIEKLRILLNQWRQDTPSWLPEPPDLSSGFRQIQPFLTQAFGNFYSFFSNSIIAVGQLLLVIVLTLMFLGDPLSYRKALVRLFPSFYRRRADTILSECEISLDNWFGGIIINSLFIGTLSFIGLSIIGVRLVLAHALLAGLLNFIPNIGPTLSVVLPMTVALLDTGGFLKAGLVLILYVVVQQVESYWLTPTVMAKQVSLLPAATLLAQIICLQLFGIIGLFLALPLAVIAQVWVKRLLIEDILDQWVLENPNSYLATVLQGSEEETDYHEQDALPEAKVEQPFSEEDTL